MDDFRTYAGKNANSGGNSNPNNIFNLVSSLANKFDGKNQSELIKAIYSEAKKGKENGTLSNRDIDNFVTMLSPILDEKKRKILAKVAEELKKI